MKINSAECNSLKIENKLESIWCPIRKWTIKVFMSLKGRYNKYGNNNIIISRLSHNKFNIWERQMQTIINDFRDYWILKTEFQQEYKWQPNRYSVPEFIIKIFRLIDTIWKWIKDVSAKIIEKNNSMDSETFSRIVEFLWINNKYKTYEFNDDTMCNEDPLSERCLIQDIEVDMVDWKPNWILHNCFNYLKSKVSIPQIELQHIYLNFNR